MSETECTCGCPGEAGTNVYHDADCPVTLLRRAAPDLLAALEGAANVPWSMPDQLWLTRARAAIAKARGQS